MSSWCLLFLCLYVVFHFLSDLDFYRSVFLLFFFFKQKTAYEMRISDWSSDVCSSDLHAEQHDIAYTQTENTCVVIHRHPENGCIIVSARWNAEEVHEDADGDAAAPGRGDRKSTRLNSSH